MVNFVSTQAIQRQDRETSNSVLDTVVIHEEKTKEVITCEGGLEM